MARPHDQSITIKHSILTNLRQVTKLKTSKEEKEPTVIPQQKT